MTDAGKRGWVYDIERSTKGTQYAKVVDSPSRFFYLDGVLKASSESGTGAHESLVHPAMLAHPDPKRALVFGSTTGAIVKEVLKHKSIEHISLVGVEKSLLTFSKEQLHEWNDCSDVVRTNDSCLDDTRVDTIYENPNMWLHNYHATHPDSAHGFDVVILDFL